MKISERRSEILCVTAVVSRCVVEFVLGAGFRAAVTGYAPIRVEELAAVAVLAAHLVVVQPAHVAVEWLEAGMPSIAAKAESVDEQGAEKDSKNDAACR